MSEPSPASAGGERSPRLKPNWWRYTNASSLGIEIAVAIGLGWWIGHKIEQSYGEWRPWPSTLGFLVGCGAAVMAMRRVIREHRAHLAALEAKAAAEESESAGSKAPKSTGSP